MPRERCRMQAYPPASAASFEFQPITSLSIEALTYTATLGACSPLSILFVIGFFWSLSIREGQSSHLPFWPSRICCTTETFGLFCPPRTSARLCCAGIPICDVLHIENRKVSCSCKLATLDSVRSTCTRFGAILRRRPASQHSAI